MWQHPEELWHWQLIYANNVSLTYFLEIINYIISSILISHETLWWEENQNIRGEAHARLGLIFPIFHRWFSLIHIFTWTTSEIWAPVVHILPWTTGAHISPVVQVKMWMREEKKRNMNRLIIIICHLTRVEKSCQEDGSTSFPPSCVELETIVGYFPAP